ncbi:hypothetical protein RJ639_004143 [Escallonia herrerae]|uniref:Kinetochore protein Spc24 n=1 Tax=Escallonia herrerae TaxID=1293975 RepID=A0AA89AXQ0_9ASTE|nr:hypothetical protein RJ639_004143 [Escallonia herrerae]
MGETPRRFEVDKLISFSHDLVSFLKGEKYIDGLGQSLEQFKAFQAQCDTDYDDVQRSLQDYEKKIQWCKQKTDVALSEVVADAEIELFQEELEEELQREILTNEINDLERQRVSVEERRKILNKLEQDELRAEMKLSMYASVSNVIPYLDDQSKISGYIVERDKKVVEKFEFDLMKTNVFDTCNSIWKMINL